jgi:predicted nucleotidyltransferase
VADLDFRPERRELLAAELCAAFAIAIPGSDAILRGSLGSGRADHYSDIDISWVVPDDSFAVAEKLAADAARRVRPLTSLRIDPALARSDRRRLVFLRLASLPLFWRVDLDIRAHSVAADEAYDAGNVAARSEAGWSRPASAIENAVAALKAAARGQASTADGLLQRGYQRVSTDSGTATSLPASITRLADYCACLQPDLADLAAEVREASVALAGTGLLPSISAG